MDAASFHTQQVKVQSPSGETGNGALKGGNGVFSGAPGLNFIDMILARMAAEGELKTGETQEALSKLVKNGKAPDDDALKKLLNSLKAALPEDAELSLKAGDLKDLKVSLRNMLEGATDMESLKKTPIFEALSDSGKKKFTALLNHLLRGTPKNGKGLSAGEANAIEPGNTDQTGTLISSGLTIGDITDVLSELLNSEKPGAETFKLKNLEKSGKEELGAIAVMAMMVKIVQPPQKGDLSSPRLAAMTGRNGKNPFETLSKMTALTMEGKGDSALKSDSPNLGEFLKLVEMSQENLRGQIKLATANAGAAGNNGAAQKLQSLSHVLQPSANNGSQTIFMSAFSAELTFDGATMSDELLLPNGTASQSLSITNPGSMTNPVTHAQHASQPHPATQMVAAQISKAASQGENSQFRIRLHPPELGRLEIKMDITKDTNGVKTHILVEKPETMQMLQRDSHALEKALQEAGLETDGSSLSFELAHDESAFDRQQNQQASGGKNDKGGNSNEAGGESEDNIIETTMNWYADPDTGVMRYDLLV